MYLVLKNKIIMFSKLVEYYLLGNMFDIFPNKRNVENCI